MNGSQVHVACRECGASLKLHHDKVRAGLSVTCVSCGRSIVFETASEDRNVRKALAMARKLRLSLTFAP